MSKRRFHWNDPRTGLIELYNAQGVRLTHMRYRGAHHRSELIERWREHYGREKFASFHFAITPDIHEESLAQLDLRRPEGAKWGLQGSARVLPKVESPLEVLKRQLGMESGEKCSRDMDTEARVAATDAGDSENSRFSPLSELPYVTLSTGEICPLKTA